MPQVRGGAELTIHHFTRRELVAELAVAGFRVRELTPVTPVGELKAPWLLPELRAYGYLIGAA